MCNTLKDCIGAMKQGQADILMSNLRVNVTPHQVKISLVIFKDCT